MKDASDTPFSTVFAQGLRTVKRAAGRGGSFWLLDFNHLLGEQGAWNATLGVSCLQMSPF